MANITILEAFTISLTNTKSYIDKIAATKVDKVDGKGLSTNDLTDTLKSNYETAYAHSQAAHAPVNAQKNSDITKAEIEAKLTGQITSHTHAETYTLPAATSSTLGGIKVGKGLSITADGILNTATSGDTAHTHSNMEVLDSISSEKVAIWDAKSDFNGDYNNLTNKPIIILTAAENEFIILSELAAGAYLITGLVKYMSTDTAPQSFDNSFVEVTKFDSLTIVADPSYITVIDSINNKPTIPTVTNDLTNELKANYDAAYTHSTSTHAPSNAQKNSDILKSEIEAKLTGNITSHTHSQYLTSIPAEYITEAELNTKGYAPLDSPNFTNSISMGRKSDTTIGAQSVALGYNTTASGFASHAEGNLTTASGDISHAEGINTIASGEASHAEGGNTTASGAGSHAEGGGTIASSESQHVQGRYNIEDTERKYAHIVGNGTSDTARSNAHTLDWDGNAWYSGKVTVGTAPTADMDVATKQYVDDTVAANAGSGTGSTADYGPYSIRYNSSNDRLEFIYTPTNTTT